MPTEELFSVYPLHTTPHTIPGIGPRCSELNGPDRSYLLCTAGASKPKENEHVSSSTLPGLQISPRQK